MRDASLERVEAWFAAQGWAPFAFQRECWERQRLGRSGLLHAPTGHGKTLAAWMGEVLAFLRDGDGDAPRRGTEPLRVLWLTPLRALANDTVESLRRPVEDLGLPWSVEARTGDASSSLKQRIRRNPPTALVTTPESLSLMLSQEGTREKMSGLRLVVVDEWHELLGTKRGVQAELCLARLRQWRPRLRTWGISATLGNIDEALAALLGPRGDGDLVRGDAPKDIVVETLAPAHIDRFPWAGHLGLHLLGPVLERLEPARSTLLFTNTRSQAEMWFRAILDARPQWEESLALHHGSLDRELRAAHEEGLKSGRVRCVVCTSSLDLGVDFSPVDQVIQVGSPKGVARLLQRAGRSGHQPGATSRILGVPTHAWELVEFAAARDAARALALEARPPLLKPLDVLAQHVVTVALGEGFDPRAMLEEARSTHAYASLGDEEWAWVLEFVTRGGRALGAYPQYHKVAERDGRMVVESREIARLHRLSIGTITSDASVAVRFANGARVGMVEESFIGRLRPGDRFLFGGRALELVRVRDMTATVRRASGARGATPRWMGGRMPLSSQLAAGVRAKLDEARRGELRDDEMRLVAPLLEVQARWSSVPAPDELLVELHRSRDGLHLMLFPFAGRLVHEGLAPLLAMRVDREHPRAFGLHQTDYGLELHCTEPFPVTEESLRRWLSTERLVEDLLECVHSTELARRQFRGVARVAGLVFDGYPGRQKSTRQLQVSSALLFDVFQRFDPGNLLMEQARREVLEGQLEVARLRETLESVARQRILLREPPRLTPFAFPIWAERIRETVGSERAAERLERMLRSLEKAAEEPVPCG